MPLQLLFYELLVKTIFLGFCDTALVNIVFVIFLAIFERPKHHFVDEIHMVVL